MMSTVGGVDVAGAREALRRADAVCFDFDSTLIAEEGIDELAKFCGAGDAVKEWTTKAMDGNIKFEEALAARLELIRPSRRAIDDFLRARPPEPSPNARALIAALKARGAAVHVISGGFRAMIEPLALGALGVDSVFANVLRLHDETGEYAGFDAAQPTARDGGKPAVVAELKRLHRYETVVMVGDGATDAQAKPPADAFVGYGGVVQRDAVKAIADWYVTDFLDLIAALDDDSSSSEAAPAAASSS